MFNRNAFMVAAALGCSLLAFNADARNKKFSCPLPNGAKCMSVEQVYEATHNRSSLDASPVVTQPLPAAPIPVPPIPVAGQPVPRSTRCCDPVRTDVTVVGETLAVSSPSPGYTGYQTVAVAAPAAVPVATTVAAPVAPRGESYRQPAKVMRIFITPWEDEAGDLHMGGYVLTEVEPRRWSVGVRAPADGDTFRLVTQSPVRETAQDASTSTGTATPEDVRTGNSVASNPNQN